MNELIESFVSGLEMDSDGRICLRGAVVHEPTSSPDGDIGKLQLAMTECVYKYLYTHPDGHIGEAFRDAPDDIDLIAALAEVGSPPAGNQSGWMIDNVLPDGSIIASRYSKTQKFLPGQYVAEPDQIPIREGMEVAVTPRLKSRTQQPGFYFFFSQSSLDLCELPPMVRIYLNARLDTAADLTRTVTDTLNDYEIAFNFKITTRACDFSRRDCAVLYLPRRMYRVATLALAPKVQRMAQLLDEGEPLFTRRLAPGIGLAEDPGTSTQSFGSSRCGILAEAILAARAGRSVPLDRFRQQFASSVSSRDLLMNALFLNPRSEDIYDLSNVWRLC